jgi:formylglycine-generating enzyme required for sulfatase activity
MPGTAASTEAPAPLSSFKDCETCPEMVALPPGKFLMGASKEDRKFADSSTLASELPQHEVAIDYSFALGRFEVTVAEFAVYVADTGVKTGGECQIRIPDFGPNKGKFIGTLKVGAPENMPGLAIVTDGDFLKPGAMVSEQFPATCISRREAAAYLAWLSKKSGRAYRFPTEAEWEYATRAGTTTPFLLHGPIGDLCKYANFADRKSPYGAGMAAPCAEQPSPEGLMPVGRYRQNGWGLFDMIGNAFEFIEDCRFPNYRGAPTDGSPWRQDNVNACDEGFVSRGYYFDSVYTDMRSAARCTAGNEWDERANFLGLRVAVSLDERAWDRR